MVIGFSLGLFYLSITTNISAEKLMSLEIFASGAFVPTMTSAPGFLCMALGNSIFCLLNSEQI